MTVQTLLQAATNADVGDLGVWDAQLDAIGSRSALQPQPIRLDQQCTSRRLTLLDGKHHRVTSEPRLTPDSHSELLHEAAASCLRETTHPAFASVRPRRP